MPSSRTIYYACPDSSFPSGGVRRIYRHVELLNKHGFRAFVLHASPSFKLDWFSSDAPVCYRDRGVTFSPSDVLVIPEVMTKLMRDTQREEITRIAIALNWAFVFGALPLGSDWRTYGISKAIAGSLYEQQFLKSTMQIEAPVVTAGIDCDSFHPDETKVLQIAYMPVQRSMAREILGAFKAKYKRHSDVLLEPMENKTHREVASILSRSSIFLAATFPQGIGRPVLEAMASGCIVVGFAGRGGAECMQHLDNSYVAEDGDVLSAVDLLNDALESIRSGTAIAMRRAARETALRYSLDAEEASVIEIWTELLHAEGKQSGSSRPIDAADARIGA